MPHCDPDVLALVALGELASDADHRHLRQCDTCRDEVTSLREVVDAVRVDVPAGPAVAPPPQVWSAIAAATGVSVAPRTVAPGAPDAVVPAPVDLEHRRASRDRGQGRGAGARTGRRPALALAAAALVIGAAGGSLVTGLIVGDRSAPSVQATPPSPRPTVVGTTRLAGLALAPAASGTASVVSTAAGPRLQVDVAALGKAPDGFYEVWLIDRQVKRMVPVGVLQGRSGQFAIPADLDLATYPVVDISVQHPGDTGHSGRSVLRGTIQG